MTTHPPARLQALLAALAAAISAFTILRAVSAHDEGLMLEGAWRIVHGQWIYRDFWSNYAPGQFVVLAALQGIFGPTLLAWRVVRVLVDAATALLAWRLARREGAGPGAALGCWLAVACAMAWPSLPAPTATATMLALGALLAAPGSAQPARATVGGFSRPIVTGGALFSVAARRRRGGPGAAALAGLLAGLAGWFRPELGVAALIGVMLCGAGPGAVVAACATGLVLWTPFLIAAGGDLFSDLVGYLGIAGLQRLPLPLLDPPSAKPNKLLEYWFAAILVLGCAAWLVVSARDRMPARTWAMAPLLACGVAFLLSRPDEFHLVPLSVALAIALASQRHPVLLAGLALIALHGVDRRVGQLLHPPPHAKVPGGIGDGVWTAPEDAAALRGLVPYVRGLTRPGDPVFVAVPRYDRVRVGDPLLNVLLNRRNPTRYDVVQPGLVTKASVQREMVADLAGTRVVVVWRDPAATRTEDDGSARSSGVRILQRYVEREFRADRRFGHYEVRVRAGSAPA